jgi:fermentation-respiration switch protein FrsA (DUF1100 family)
MKDITAKAIACFLFGFFLFFMILLGTLYMQQRHMIYPADTSPVVLPSLEDVSVTTAGVITEDVTKINGWFLMPKTKTQDIVVLFHGNAGNISHRLGKALDFVNSGYGVLLVEYRGYGGNPGEPSEAGLYRDAHAYLKWLRAQGYEPEDMIFYGESLGSGVAVEMALHYPPKALILETPYSNFSAIAKKHYGYIPFIDALLIDKFDSVSKIDQIDTPKLFLIAGKDEVLGAQTGLELYEKASEPKTLKVFDQAGHNNLHKFEPFAAISQFLETLK